MTKISEVVGAGRTFARRIHNAGFRTAADKHPLRHYVLWSLQGWLALFYIAAGYAKLTEPKTSLDVLLAWSTGLMPIAIKVIGAVELLLAIGVVAPIVLWRKGWPIMVLCAFLLGLEQIVMLLVHAARLELGLAAVNGVLLIMTIAILWGRRPE